MDIKDIAREWAVDYKPFDNNLPPNKYAEYGFIIGYNYQKNVDNLHWLRKNKLSLSIRGIERQLKMPDSTLIKALNGSQSLPKKWTKPLTKFVNNLVKL